MINSKRGKVYTYIYKSEYIAILFIKSIDTLLSDYGTRIYV